jgi:predicted dehydrogenase
MKQVLQSLKNGAVLVEDIASPLSGPGQLLVRTRQSLISSGTERMLLDFGRAGWLGKIRQQPERWRTVIAKLRSEGLGATWEAIRAKLEAPLTLGYCNVGEVLDTGGLADIQRGQRVVSNSPHAEVVLTNPRLMAAVPDRVSDEAATFTPLAAIAWEGISLLQIQPGDRVMVIGLGLIGQLAVRLLKGMGREVLGADPDPARRTWAEKYGVRAVPAGDGTVDEAMAWTKGKGVTGVLITASSPSHSIVNEAARSCCYRGRVVLVGVVGLKLNRADFYRNEISFQVSCSYGRRDHTGPGSLRANFRQVLTFMDEGKLPLEDLITHRFPFSEARLAYGALQDKDSLGILLEYGAAKKEETGENLLTREIPLQHPNGRRSKPRICFLGAGNFAVRTLLPALAKVGVRPAVVVSRQGASALYAGRKFGAVKVGTDPSVAWSDPELDTVFIATRHHLHADQSLAALKAGKHVWLEKPLCLNLGELSKIETAYPAHSAQSAARPLLTVGFNRRFAPMAVALKKALMTRGEPIEIRIKVNAGRLERGHWVLDPEVGGGRIVGEVCHFIDLARYLAGSPIVSLFCLRRNRDGQDGGCFQLQFQDGSKTIIEYRTDLPAHLPKEAVEVTGKGFSAKIHNWTRLRSRGLGWLCKGGFWSRTPRKGHEEAVKAFLKAIKGGPEPIPAKEIFEVSEWAIKMQGMREGEELKGRSEEKGVRSGKAP